MTEAPAADRAATRPSAAGLQGSECPACGVVMYPTGAACPRCGHRTNPTELSREGVLWTWTVQRFAPKTPPYEPPSRGFQPFAVGYVELPEGVRVEAIVEVEDLESLHVGMPVRLAPSTGVPRFAAVSGSSRAGRQTEVARS